MPRYTHQPNPPEQLKIRYSHPPSAPPHPLPHPHIPIKRIPTTETIIIDLADLARQKNASRQQNDNTTTYARAPKAPSPPKKGGYDERYAGRRRAATMNAVTPPSFPCTEFLRFGNRGACYHPHHPVTPTTYAHPSAAAFIPTPLYHTPGPFIFPVRNPPPVSQGQYQMPDPAYNDPQGYIPHHPTPHTYDPRACETRYSRNRSYRNRDRFQYNARQEEGDTQPLRSNRTRSYTYTMELRQGEGYHHSVPAAPMEETRRSRHRSYTDTRELGREERHVHFERNDEGMAERERERWERMRGYEKAHLHLRR